MMPLSMLEKGKISAVKEIHGKDDVKRFLENLGFVTGANVVVVSQVSGDLIVNVKDTRVALSKSMANRIIV